MYSSREVGQRIFLPLSLIVVAVTTINLKSDTSWQTYLVLSVVYFLFLVFMWCLLMDWDEKPRSKAILLGLGFGLLGPLIVLLVAAGHMM